MNNTASSENNYDLTGNSLQDIKVKNVVADDATGFYGEIVDVTNDIVEIDWYDASDDQYAGSTEINAISLLFLTQDATVNIWTPKTGVRMSSLERTLKTALSAIAGIL